MRLTACFDILNNRCVFACEDAFAQKDILKSLGFHWNSNAKEWQKFYNTPAELTCILMETMLRCDCPLKFMTISAPVPATTSSWKPSAISPHGIASTSQNSAKSTISAWMVTKKNPLPLKIRNPPKKPTPTKQPAAKK